MTTKKAEKESAKKKAKGSPKGAADAIDRQLARYRSMRNFGVTAEPAGGTRARRKSPAIELPFVIQKHAATRLHYDFRLGWNGVLKSWAVAKGPSYVTADKRLAVEVEDHPMEYGGFEGIIPKGQYGGGTVMVWDEGTWEPQPGHQDIDEGLRKGSLKFTLHGAKLKGKWTLVRMGGRAAREDKPNWLLIKEHDEFERSPEEPPITEEEPDSAVTGRSLEQIAASASHVWNSKDTASKGKAWYRQKANSTTAQDGPKSAANGMKRAAPAMPGLIRVAKEALPDFIDPQLAKQAFDPPSSGAWLHELKLDGYRIQARIHKGRVRLLTRTGLDWTHRLKPMADALANMPAEAALLDGEVCVVRRDGTTSFADLQASFEGGEKHRLTYFVFDLLHLDGHNLRPLPLETRKKYLALLIAAHDTENVLYSDHLGNNGAQVFRHACALHAEGIISKRADRPYHSGRSSDWVKLKCVREQEFVIGGFVLPSNGIRGIGALLLGYYDSKGHLIYAGRSGTGFTAKTHKLLRDKLDRLRRDTTPFFKAPAEARRNAIWLKPESVAQVAFATWTADNLVRQAAFKGLREDKPAREVRREETAPPAPRKRTEGARDESPSVRMAGKQEASTRSRGGASMAMEEAPIRLTNPDKILDPESGMTKRQLADYYWAVAAHMLPHIANRPLSLVRCPEGSAKPCFFQKHVTGTLPAGIESVSVKDKKSGQVEPYITLSTPEAVAGLAQMGVLEIHPWASQNDRLETPDRVIFDLDPDASIPWATLAEAAGDVRKRLKKIGLESFLKTTGGKGLHVVVPIDAKHEFSVVKQWAHEFVLQMERDNPRLYLTKMTKAARTNKIYLDYLRNERGATAVAPFSPRARAGAPVSLPLSWSELRLAERPLFRVVEFSAWRKRLGSDPWKAMTAMKQRLPFDETKQMKSA